MLNIMEPSASHNAFAGRGFYLQFIKNALSVKYSKPKCKKQGMPVFIPKSSSLHLLGLVLVCSL